MPVGVTDEAASEAGIDGVGVAALRKLRQDGHALAIEPVGLLNVQQTIENLGGVGVVVKTVALPEIAHALGLGGDVEDTCSGPGSLAPVEML